MKKYVKAANSSSSWMKKAREFGYSIRELIKLYKNETGLNADSDPKAFSDWCKNFFMDDIKSYTSIKASESIIYEDDYCRITDFGNGQAEYFDDRTNFYLPIDWANKIADTIKSGKTDRAANMIERAEKKFYEDKRAGKEQKWVRTELNKEDADQMKYYLKKKGIYYEASLMDDGWIHFEVKATDDEIEDINKFIDTL